MKQVAYGTSISRRNDENAVRIDRSINDRVNCCSFDHLKYKFIKALIV